MKILNTLKRANVISSNLIT